MITVLPTAHPAPSTSPRVGETFPTLKASKSQLRTGAVAGERAKVSPAGGDLEGA